MRGGVGKVYGREQADRLKKLELLTWHEACGHETQACCSRTPLPHVLQTPHPVQNSGFGGTVLFHENSNIGPEPLMNSSAVSSQVSTVVGDQKHCLGCLILSCCGLTLCMNTGLSSCSNWSRPAHLMYARQPSPTGAARSPMAASVPMLDAGSG